MKKQLLLITILLLIMTTFSFADVNITVNDKLVQFNDDLGYPFIDKNNRTLVPFRVVLETFGATVGWDTKNQAGVADMNGIQVKVPIGQNYILKNDTQVMNDTHAVIKDGRTYLPIRVVIEALGGMVQWWDSCSTVSIYTEDITIDPRKLYQASGYVTDDWAQCDIYEMPISDNADLINRHFESFEIILVDTKEEYIDQYLDFQFELSKGINYHEEINTVKRLLGSHLSEDATDEVTMNLKEHLDLVSLKGKTAISHIPKDLVYSGENNFRIISICENLSLEIYVDYDAIESEEKE